MASADVYDAIRAHLEANWTATALGFDNEDKDASGNRLPPEPQAIWVLVEMTGTLYAQESIGASEQADNRWDEEGTLFLHVETPTGWGSRGARAQAKALADLFRGQSLMNDDLEFLEASIGLGERGDSNGNWFRISVSIEWRRWDA